MTYIVYFGIHLVMLFDLSSPHSAWANPHFSDTNLRDLHMSQSFKGLAHVAHPPALKHYLNQNTKKKRGADRKKRKQQKTLQHICSRKADFYDILSAPFFISCPVTKRPLRYLKWLFSSAVYFIVNIWICAKFELWRPSI